MKLGSYRWFLGDEWDFLAGRSAFNLDDLFRPHNQHWSTLPLLVYRGLFSVFGVRTYVPYQMVVILLYLVACGLLRWITRRAGVSPWIATVCIGALVLFGPGSDDIIWAFQIGFVGAVVFGLTQFLLADHPGGLDRRDWLGLGAGLLALMCSGQGPSVIVATGIAVLLRRGWRMAAFHTVPLGIVFLTWYELSGAARLTRLDGSSISTPPFTFDVYVHWMWNAAKGLVDGLGHFGIIAAALGVLLLSGWALEIMTHGWRTFRGPAALPAALFVGALVGTSLTAPQRFFLQGNEASVSRYLAVTALMTMPAFAFAAHALVQRWRWAFPVVLALFLIPIPWNIKAFDPGDDPILGAAYYRRAQAFVTAIPDSPLATQVPGWVQPDSSFLGMPDMSVGWLIDAEKAGELPPPIPMEASNASQMPVKLGVVVLNTPSHVEQSACQTFTQPTTVKPKVGDQWTYFGDVSVSTAKNGKRTSFPVAFSTATENNHIEITLPNLELLLEPSLNNTSYQICT